MNRRDLINASGPDLNRDRGGGRIAAPEETGAASTVERSAVATGARGRVWLTGQRPPRSQRAGRYVPGSVAHPAKMLPAIAAHAIATYSQPGDLVLDPMCGIGTTMVEAIRAGRRAVGVEYEPRWAHLAAANLALAAADGHTTPANVVRGDARQLAHLLPDELRSQVGLIVTSPPYGPSTHGHVTHDPSNKIVKINHRYGSILDRGNLANIGHHRLLVGFTRILTAATEFLQPGGHVVITVRPWREHAELIDLPAQITTCGEAAGLIPVQRCVALLGRITEHGHLVAQGSFFQRDFITKQRRAGLPLHLIAHEDVIVLAKPATTAAAAASAVPPAAARPPQASLPHLAAGGTDERTAA
ncbi:TRM11 family SAM-dependent methyltransferase [Pseudonocardia adelaidensis]|uniref:Methyltransferase n=1 Tax=Pseudonocardia adelaidensis TaxID=648754 RepID=A0ABP9P771_9PSEU